MARQRKKSVTIIALVLAALMVLSFIFMIATELTARANNIAELDRQINQARNQISDLEGQGEALDVQMGDLAERLRLLRAQEDSYLEELHLLQEQLRLLEERIELTEEQIAIYKGMIADKELRLEEAIQREQEQLDRLMLRIRTMEEAGSLSYLQIIFSAQSFSDLITRIHDVSEIMAYDQRLSEALEIYRTAVHDFKLELESDREELLILIAQLEAEQAQLEIERAQLQARIDDIKERIEAGQIELAALEEDRRRVEELISAHVQTLEDLTEERRAAIAELERQAAASGGGGGISTGARPTVGMFMWPSDSSQRVSSWWGPRASPGGIGSTYHRGIDIGAAHGTNVIAAASGVVTFSGWSGGFGNYIVINHGGGYATAYAHMSQNLVRTGDNVIQGQIIGLVGSTGNSTGPHIHFEVHRNGVRVDPAPYFGLSGSNRR